MHNEHPNADPAFEYSEIDEHVTIGTNACCQTHFEKSLLAKGVTADISLESEAIDRPFGIHSYLWLPTVDHTPLSTENVLVGIAALKQMIKNGQKVYIHCKNGHGRGPTLYAAYLIKEAGMSPEAAVESIKAKRPGIHLEESQRIFLQKLASSL